MTAIAKSMLGTGRAGEDLLRKSTIVLRSLSKSCEIILIGCDYTW